MYRYLIPVILFLSAGRLTGQGWERTYPGGANDEAHAIAQTPDGGFIMTGIYNGQRVHLLKTDIDGHLQWSKFVQDAANLSFGNAITVTSDTGYVIAGVTKNGSNRDIYLLKTDAFGNILWSKSYGQPDEDEEALGLVTLPDGGFAICGTNTTVNDLIVLRTDAVGGQLWLKTYGEFNSEENGKAITLADNGDIVVTGRMFDNPIARAAVMRLDEDGNIVWSYNYSISGAANAEGQAIVALPDGSFAISGNTDALGGFLLKIGADGTTVSNPVTYSNARFFSIVSDREDGYFLAGNKESGGLDDLYILHTDGNGAAIWDAKIGKGSVDGAYCVIATPDGGAAAAGVTENFVDLTGIFEYSVYLVKTDSDGVVFTNYVQGNVFNDLDANCLPDPGEPELGNFLLKLSNADETFTRYIIADQHGKFEILTDTGSYNIELYAPNDYWKTCSASVSFNIPDFYDTVQIDIPVRKETACTRNEVEIATPALRRCADNVYTVRYCNSGTDVSFNTAIDVTFDNFLSVNGSSIPWVSQSGQTYTFNVGTLSPGQCESFTVTAFLDCSTAAGETHCATAHIFPDTFCNAGNWDGSTVYAKAVCNGDSTLQLQLGRTGGTSGTLKVDFVIVEDILMLTDPNDPPTAFMDLAEPDTTVFTSPADGKTRRLIVTNIDNYNYPGLSFPTAAVEGCGTDSSGNFSTGFYTMFPEDEADAFVASECQESYETDYNSIYFKRGHPKGYDVEHYVSPQTDLDFLIYFRNSGSDTVHQVIVRDTLSAALDPATVYPGAASHPYDFQVYGNGIVQFTIPNANLLPDGSGGGTDGFVSFRVSQKPVENCETVIYNTAAIYFDFNAPVHSNETFHTICERDSFLIVNTKPGLFPGAELKVYPNPFFESATFEITGIDAQTYTLDIYDILGRHIANRTYTSSKFRLLRQQIPPGAYIYRIAADGVPVASGKILAGNN